MTSPLSGERESFERKQDFKRNANGVGWVCNICPVNRDGQLQFPTLKAALNHEQTSREHARHVSERIWWAKSDESGWGTGEHPSLTSEGLRQWEMHAHVDQVFDLVPFWRKAVDAAERGEVLRLEEFLEKMEGGGGWRTAHEVLEMLGKGANCLDGEHGSSQQDRFSVQVASDATEMSSGRGWGAVEEQWGLAQEPQHEQKLKAATQLEGYVDWDTQLLASRQFVDTVARQSAVNEERRRQMHKFFEMPTEQKVQKIQEIICFLRNHH